MCSTLPLSLRREGTSVLYQLEWTTSGASKLQGPPNGRPRLFVRRARPIIVWTQSRLLLIHPTSPISFFSAESLQRCLRKHLLQHGHEIPLGESTCTIAQHRHRAGGLGVSEEPLDLIEQRDRLLARRDAVLRRSAGSRR